MKGMRRGLNITLYPAVSLLILSFTSHRKDWKKKIYFPRSPRIHQTVPGEMPVAQCAAALNYTFAKGGKMSPVHVVRIGWKCYCSIHADFYSSNLWPASLRPSLLVLCGLHDRSFVTMFLCRQENKSVVDSVVDKDKFEVLSAGDSQDGWERFEIWVIQHLHKVNMGCCFFGVFLTISFVKHFHLWFA